MKAKPKIFLADLIHNQYGYNYCVPLNIGCLAATLKQKFADSLDLRLFKFPDRLIKALDEKPDILAVSNYDWNVNLNRAVIQMAQKRNPDIFVVMGGPNIRYKPEGIKQFLEKHSYVNAYVMFEGEEAFAGIVSHLLGREGSLHTSLIERCVELKQVAYLAPHDGSLVMGSLYPSVKMKHIPHASAWLSGYLDPYLNCKTFPLSPIIETTRGCPHRCTYCTSWGTTFTGVKTVREFELETVFEELEYIFKNAEQDFYLIVGDANLGILKRDVLVAEKIKELSGRYGKLTSVGIDTSKSMIHRNVEIYKTLGNLSVPTFALQTFNEDILRNTRRKNVSFNDIRMLVDKVHTNGSSISTDLLVGLPGESKQAHIHSIKKAFDAGFDKFQIADIRLLLGTEMEEDSSRDHYGIKTKARIIPNAFGVYGGHKVIEYENCIRETDAMSEMDFLELRLLHGHIFLMLNLEIGRPLLDFAQHHGLHQVDLIADISTMPPPNEYPLLSKQFKVYMENSMSEWFDTPDEADAYYMQEQVFGKLQEAGFSKLNYEYASNLIVDTVLADEFFKWITINVKNHLPEISTKLIDELTIFSDKRIIHYPVNDNSPSESMEISNAALKEVSNYVTNYDDEVSQNAEKQVVKFTVDELQTEKIQGMVSANTAARSDQHAVQLVLQFHNKLFIRNALIARDNILQRS